MLRSLRPLVATAFATAFAAAAAATTTTAATATAQEEGGLQQTLEAIVGEDDVKSDLPSREPYGQDANSYHAGALPALVVRPHSTAQVSAILQACSASKTAVVPYGSGTSLEGHTTAGDSDTVTLDLGAHMGGIQRLSVADMDVTVGAGMTWGELNDELRPHGLFFPMDPGPGASIGGMVGTGCSGTNAVRYGTMAQNVLSLEVVLADGSVVRTGRRSRKSSAGYDLTRLFVGSEGTLGVVTAATLRLEHLPEHTAVAVVQFETVAHAAAAVMDIRQRGVQIGCVELLDAPMVRAVNLHSDLEYAERPTILFKFAGAAPVVEHSVGEARRVCERHGGGAFQWADSEEAREALWDARKVCLWAAMSLRPGAAVWTTDVCVPISRLADCIAETQADIAASPLQAPIVGHVGDGNFHVFFLVDPEDPAELAEAKRLNARMIRRAIAMDGTCTGEHGVGVGKREYLPEELGEPAVALMRRVKEALDPEGVLNPGKVLPPPPPPLRS